jgi:DNA-binding NarL/FixJ family response regulator
MDEVRVVVVEDHPLFRRAVADLVDAMDDWRTVAEHADAESALDGIADADVAVVDVGLDGMDGVAAVSRFLAVNPSLKVLMLTMSSDPGTVAAALRAGALGYVVKGSEPEDIAAALRAVSRGQAIFGRPVADAVRVSAARAEPSRASASFPELSGRELEVLDMIAAGRSNAEIADLLFISPKTARNHVSAILTKLGCTRPEAVARGKEAGLGR